MSSTQPTPAPKERSAGPDKNRRYLSPEEAAPDRNRRYLSRAEMDNGAALSGPAASTSAGVADAPVQTGSADAADAETAVIREVGPEQTKLAQEELITAARNGDYAIQDMLARGAESVLYRATSGDATVCVKAIRNVLGLTIGSSATRSQGGKLDVSYRSKVRHLRNEFAVGTALQEEGDIPVVRIYALRKVRRFGVEMGYDLLMEHIVGVDMGDRQLMRGLSVIDKIDVFHQTLKALAFMHYRRYIHLDIKPSNIMLGADGRVKLIDFGVSVSLGHRPRAVTGTAGYLSPEQIVREYLNEATDIFSLGVTFAVIFGGKPLRQSPEELKSRQFRSEARYHMENVDRPTMLDMPELGEFPELIQLIGQCTVPRRDKRIGSTSMLISRLEHLAADRGIRLPLVRG